MKKILFAAAMMFTAVYANAWNVGEYYNENGVEGIVVKVDDTGEHGLVMSLKRSGAKWLADKEQKLNTGLFYEDDGAKNMAVLEKHIEKTGGQWSQYPVFEWCRSLGEGWYLPAKDELVEILNAINGGEGKYNEKQAKAIDKIIKSKKGDTVRNTAIARSAEIYTMFSSTETDNGLILALQYDAPLLAGKGKLKVNWQVKNMGGKFLNVGSRAVHKF